MLLKSALRKAERGLPIRVRPELTHAVHWVPARSYPVHRWFRYREGFAPSLFKYFTEYERRLDPFCGCGTTLLESARQGFHSYGVDLNPLATFVARAKVRPYSKKDQTQLIQLSHQALKAYPKLQCVAKPPYPLLDKLFQRKAMNVLLRLRNFIDCVEDKKMRELLLLAWLSILEDCSNVFKEGNGLKYRNKRRKPGSYETLPDDEWIPKYFGDSVRTFIEGKWRDKCTQMAEDIARVRMKPGFQPRVRCQSCLKLSSLDFGTMVDLAIFSPPYANRFDYFEAFKMELWMGGFVKSSQDMARLRSQSFCNNLAARKRKSENVWDELSPFLNIMDPSASSVRMGIKEALNGYFQDIRILLSNISDILSKRGRVVIVIGNSAYAKSIIPTDILIARIAQEEGYHVNSIDVARSLHVSSQQRRNLKKLETYMRESMIILRKRR